MRRLKVVALLMVLLVPLFTSCELLDFLDPDGEDQDLNNPFGLNGEGVEVGMAGAVATFLVPFADGNGTVTATFEDFTGLPPLLPSTISFDQPLATTATLSGTTDYPTTITLSNVRLSVRIWDTQDDLTLNFPAHGSAQLNHLGDGEYSMSNINFSVDLTGSTMMRIHGIITEGGTNNVEAEISLTATSDPDLPEGAVIEMVFGGGQGRVEF